MFMYFNTNKIVLACFTLRLKFFFFFYVISTPHLGLELMTPRSRVCSMD